MADTFIVIEVTEEASDSEPMGTKPKFWFFHDELGQCLYKESRPGTGEDWSEKIASELCALLGLPHARYELAIHQGKRGTISPIFIVTPKEILSQLSQMSYWGQGFWGEGFWFEPPKVRLTHGNELLFSLVPSYPKPSSARKYRVSQHTLDLVLNTIRDVGIQSPPEWTPPPGIATAVDTFIGYLLLDAWISNTDRHHENWGIVEWIEASTRNVTRYLAPTYDHASSLGCHVTDDERLKRLGTTDQGYSVEAYTRKSNARSALYLKMDDRKALFMFDAFKLAAERYPQAARVWLDRLASMSNLETDKLFERLPSERITEPGIQFARKILDYNRGRLLDLRSELP